MNFYKHHIGDYEADTSHLSWDEDMAYSRMIRAYYRTEKPLPKEEKDVCRLIRAKNKVQRDAVSVVLNEFFFLEADGWHQKRCDGEIELAKAKAEKNKENGKSGGRPRKGTPETEPKNNPDGLFTDNPNGYVSESENNLSQTPDSRDTSDDSVVGGTRKPEPDPNAGTRAGHLCKRLRLAGIPDAAPHLLRSDAWAAMLAIRTDDEVLAVAEIAKAKRPNDRLSLNYLLPMLRDQAPASLTGGQSHATRQGSVAATVAAFTGRSSPDSGDGGGEETVIEGSATRIPETG